MNLYDLIKHKGEISLFPQWICGRRGVEVYSKLNHHLIKFGKYKIFAFNKRILKIFVSTQKVHRKPQSCKFLGPLFASKTACIGNSKKYYFWYT